MYRVIKILFLAANPSDTTQLRLDQEVRSIDEKLRQTEYRDQFDIIQHWAVRVADLQGYLLRYSPTIVHFSGHGSSSSEIILEDNYGNSQPVSERALNQLFYLLKDNIRCVVLNACHSEPQAKAIANHIDCVIGISKAISDSAAISFSASFYQALGYGRDIKTAFDWGCGQIDLEGLSEQDTPKLWALKSKPNKVFLFTESQPDDQSLKSKDKKQEIKKGQVESTQSKLARIADITSIFWIERFVYLSAIVICLIILIISIAISLVTREIGNPEIVSLFGSGGVITVMTGRLLNMWDRAIKLLNKSVND